MADFGMILVGGAIGFFASIGKDYFNEKHKNKLKEKEFKRQKLEEVFMLKDEFLKEVNNKIIGDDYSVDSSLKLTMLIRLYFPSLAKGYNSFLNACQEATNKNATNEMTREANFQHAVFTNLIVEEAKKYVPNDTETTPSNNKVGWKSMFVGFKK